ncbi:MAG: thiol reductant ABC exporter subunit CydD [Chloroflexota bacterium]|nr:MAG: thiol reductant ABC exporter subunit CydD [Chloroflexota bacterium]
MHLEKRLRIGRAALALTIGLGVIAGLLLVAQAFLLSRAINLVFLQGAALADILPLLASLLGVGAARALALWGGEVSAQGLAESVKTDLREKLFAHILTLGPAYTRGERSGELVNTATGGIEALDAYLREYIPQVALAAFVPLIMLLTVFPIDLVSGLVLLFTAPLIPLFMILIGKAAGALNRRQWTALSRMSAHFLDVLQGLTTLKLFQRSRAQIEIIAAVSDQFRKTTLDVLRVAFLSALVLEMVATISTAVVAVEIGLRLLYGVLDFERAFFVLVLAPEFYLPLRTLGIRFHAGVAGATAARRIFEVLETPPEVMLTDNARPLPPPSFHIRLENVVYAYGDRPALNGLSLEIRPGERLALVGPSGGGKTTISQLLLRFIEPRGGQIIVDSFPLHDLPADSWREQIAWVPQNPYLFNASAADNIRLGKPSATMAEIIEAARLAGAHEFISALPSGYDTLIGERGARLSGGQAQRIALARAFLRDAPLLILDEATAHLDPETELLIQASINRLMQGRTALIIAHRLSTVYNADRIAVIDGGRVVETGAHEELLRQNGVYRQLVTAYAGEQAKPF